MTAISLARILIVDDEAANMHALCDTLRDKGYQTEGATSGEAALRMLADAPFDLVLTDLMMPGMDGVELVGAALKLDPDLVGILMTGQGTVETAVAAMQAGALDYVLKPIRLGTILPVLARALNVRRLRRENLELRNTVAIHELNQALAHTLDPQVLIEKIADAALAQFDADEVSIMLVTEDGASLHVAAVRGAGRERLLGLRVPMGHAIAGRVAVQREAIVLNGPITRADPTPPFPRDDIRSSLSMPMITRGNLVGVINVNSLRRAGAFPLGQVKILSIFTHAAAAGIESARICQAQRLSEIRYRLLIASVRDYAIIMLDPQGRVASWNDGARTMHGYEEAEILGQPMARFHVPEDVAANRPAQLLERAAADGRADDDGWRVRKNASRFQASMVITAMRDDQGRLVGFSSITRDVTERRRAEQDIRELNASLEARVAQRTRELQDANRAKDSFLATMSHEIRTPLGGLLGMLELLALSPPGGEQREILRAARDSGQSLLRILNDILDWSKIESGKLALAPRATSIARLVAEVANTYAHVASAKSITIVHHVDARLHPAVMVDPLRLSQVLNNFVSNAIKFSHEGGRIALAAELVAEHEGGAQEICFSVKDSGIGIDAQTRQRLFQNYGQASADTARMYGGTGLGLAICRRLAERLGGRIDLDSTPGQGSTFGITLALMPATLDQNPSAVADTLAVATHITPLFEGTAAANAPRVLVVDDHHLNRKLLARQLGLLGLRCETTHDGQTALPLWRDGDFALVITDCHMPKMDGYELTMAIRRIEADEARVRTPIVAWTANALADERDRCTAAGMDELLLKPAELERLRAILKRWLSIDTDTAPSAAPGQPVAPVAPHACTQALDVGVLKALVDDEPMVLIEFLRDYRASAAALAADMRMAWDAGQTEQLGALAHKLKSSSRWVGALALGESCAEIEAAVQAGNQEALPALLQRFQQERIAVQGALDLALDAMAKDAGPRPGQSV